MHDRLCMKALPRKFTKYTGVTKTHVFHEQTYSEFQIVVFYTSAVNICINFAKLLVRFQKQLTSLKLFPAFEFL